MSRFSVKYKVREGDTYENLFQRFGATLAEAGIYSDEDLVKNKEFNLGVNTREEAELLQKRDLEYQRNINKGIRQRNAKSFDDFWAQNGQDILIRYGYDRGKDKQYAEDLKESLRQRYIQGENSVEQLIAGANKKEQGFWDGTYANQKRQEQLQKMQHNAKETQKQWNSLSFTRGNSLSNPGSFQFGYSANLYNLNEPQTNVKYQEQVEKELGRKLTDQERQHLGQHAEDYQNFVKLGKGKTYQDYLKYLEGEHKSAESTRDLTRNIATGITLGAAGLGSAAASSGIGLVPNAVKNVTSRVANFGLKQVPWMAGSAAANTGLDVIAGDDQDSWANNRYVRGAANAIGMVGGNFAGGLIKGASRYGLKYIPRAAGALTQNAVGSFGSTLGSMEGMAAMDHLAEGLDVQNPYGRAAMGTVGMIMGHNANTVAMNTAKKLLGRSINNNFTKAANYATNGNIEAAQTAFDKANNQYRILDRSLVSKALDVKGSGTMPLLGSTIQHIPVGLAMQAGAFGEDVLDTDILNNPIVQGLLVKGAGATGKGLAKIDHTFKRRSGLKGDLASVVDELMYGKGTATGTYGTDMKGNNLLPKWFPQHKEAIQEHLAKKGLQFTPEMAKQYRALKEAKKNNTITPEQKRELKTLSALEKQIKGEVNNLYGSLVSSKQIEDTYNNLPPEKQADFISGNNGLRNRSYNHYDKSNGERGYLDIEHGKLNKDLFSYPGSVYQGVQKALPLDFTPEQFYAAASAKIAGPRHGFGFKYGVMVPKATVKQDFTKSTFKNSDNSPESTLIQIPGRGYVINPKFRADAGFRGSDTFLGFKDGEAKWSNIAGHVGTLIQNADGSVMKVGVDTPGYGATAKRYKGASQMLGTLLGKTLDHFTPRPHYTAFGEYLNPKEGKIFSNTTDVNSGKPRSYETGPVANYWTPTGMIPIQQEGPQSFKDYLAKKQHDKVVFSNSPEEQAKKSRRAALEAMNNHEYAKKYNSTFNVNFSEGDPTGAADKIVSAHKAVGPLMPKKDKKTGTVSSKNSTEYRKKVLTESTPYTETHQFNPEYNKRALQFLQNSGLMKDDNVYERTYQGLNRELAAYQGLLSGY